MSAPAQLIWILQKKNEDSEYEEEEEDDSSEAESSDAATSESEGAWGGPLFGHEVCCF